MSGLHPLGEVRLKRPDGTLRHESCLDGVMLSVNRRVTITNQCKTQVIDSNFLEKIAN